jgi:hypothetical protein
MSEQLPAEIEALVLQTLASRVRKQLDLSKAEFSSDYAEGDKHTFRSPIDDRRLGQIYRTDPEPVWAITDRDALTEHLMTFEGNRCYTVQIREDAPYEEILAVLHEHAPQYLEDVVTLREDAIDAALSQSKETGTPAAPGIERRKPGGALTVKPDPNAHLAIEGLVKAGLLRWDGTRALPASDQLEAS